MASGVVVAVLCRGVVGGAHGESVVKRGAKLSSVALSVQALVDGVLEVGIIAQALDVTGTVRDVLRVDPALVDASWLGRLNTGRHDGGAEEVESSEEDLGQHDCLQGVRGSTGDELECLWRSRKSCVLKEVCSDGGREWAKTVEMVDV